MKKNFGCKAALLYYELALIFIGALWFISRSILPAIGIIGSVILWQEITIVDGIEVNTAVTLWNIVVSIEFVIGGFVAAKNFRFIRTITVKFLRKAKSVNRRIRSQTSFNMIYT